MIKLYIVTIIIKVFDYFHKLKIKFFLKNRNKKNDEVRARGSCPYAPRVSKGHRSSGYNRSQRRRRRTDTQQEESEAVRKSRTTCT
jgi:hypothetical protein